MARELMLVPRERQVSRLSRTLEVVRSYWRGPWGSGDKELAKFLPQALRRRPGLLSMKRMR